MNDLRLALRSLIRNPMFSAIALATLALGIGANTAVFTLVDSVLISALLFEDSDELVAIRHVGRDGQDQLPMSQGLYQLYRDQAASIEEIALHSGTTVNLVYDGEAERISVQAVTPGFFRVLRVEPALGRTFSEEEGRPDAEQVVVLSDGIWHSNFGADPNVLGRTLDVDGASRRIIGVMPPDFGHPTRDARLWLPMIVDPAQASLASFGSSGIARLSEGSSVTALHTELEGLISRLAEIFPESGAPAFLEQVNLGSVVLPLKEAVVGEMTATFWILLGTVGFVLLIACANVANLLLVRAEGRQRELALRVAMGAGRGQVIRSFMSESALLAGGGGALGVLFAMVAVKASVGLLPMSVPRTSEIAVDLRVLGFTALVALGCAVFFGLLPLFRHSTDDLAQQLREGAERGSTGGRKGNRLRSGLVVLQMALALVLLIGSGLMLRSFQALRSIDPGFETERILTARLSVPPGEVPDWQEAAGFYRQLRDRLAAQAGVEAVGFAQAAPLTGSGIGYFNVEVEDHPREPGELPVFATQNFVEAGYLEAMGIDLMEGRTFQAGDGAEGVRSVIISENFAQRWWPEQSPVGRRMRLQGDWHEIVGVVREARYESLEAEAEEMVYWPATNGPADDPQATRTMDIVMRTATDPLQFVEVLRREVQALNPRIPVSNPRDMESVFARATSRASFTAAMLGAASSIALLLGLVGIYGVISYVVSLRTREIGVRMALGATETLVRGMVVRQGLLLASAGVGVGLLAAGALSRVMGSILYGVSATDPVTYGGVAVALVSVSLVASWIPAARAARVDPSVALRAD